MENYRYKIVETSKNFKTSWVELGEHLTAVARDKLYVEWGFSSFEEYCKTELKLKKSTAIKLTNAYFFVTNEEPELKDKDIDFDSVNTLRSIKNDDNCSPEIFSDMMDLATKGKSAQSIKKKFKDMTEQPENDTVVLYRQCIDWSKKILTKIKPIPNVPDRYKETLGEMISNFDAVISEIKNDDES